MKKRAALLLALVMICALVVGVMPVHAATVQYHTMPQYSTLTISANAIDEIEYDTGKVQAYITKNAGKQDTATITAIASYGNTVVKLKAAGKVTHELNITFTYSSGSATGTNIASAAAPSVAVKLNSYSYKDLYVNETFTATASLTGSGLRYVWNITSGNATVTSNYNGSSATIKATAAGTIEGSVTVYDNFGNSKSATFSQVAKGGTVNFIFLDRSNNNAAIAASQMSTIATMTNLPRTYSVPIGRQVGFSNYVYADASPSHVTFNDSLQVYTITVGVRKANSSYTGTTGIGGAVSGYGYVMLGNGYAIIESIEAENNLAIMTPGSTQKVTTAMLGGMPVNAPGITFAIADPKVATVDAAGKITALATGTTTLNVYYNGSQVIGKYLYVLNGAATVEPEEAVENELTLKPASVTRTLKTQKNKKFRLAAKNILLGDEKIAHDELEWSSSKTSVATVDEDGYVYIKKAGTCYIYATYVAEDGSEITARFKLTVK